MVARVVPQSARRRHAESRKPDLWGRAARPKAPVLHSASTRIFLAKIAFSSTFSSTFTSTLHAAAQTRPSTGDARPGWPMPRTGDKRHKHQKKLGQASSHQNLRGI